MQIDRKLLDDIKNKLFKVLKTDRYNHTLGVACTSACLAMRYDEDILKAELAGLLHDCAKQYKDSTLITMCKEAKIIPEDYTPEAPQIMHAVYGPYLAEHVYKIDDSDILSAIRWHTTGKADMTMLEKIVYTADYIEPMRYKSSNLPEVRKLAFDDITACVYKITEDTLVYLKSKGFHTDEKTLECYNWLKEHGAHD